MKRLGIVLLIAIIVIFNIIIGGNETDLRVLPISVLMTLVVIYLIVKKIKNKDDNIVFKSKIDYFVLFFMLITTIPVIFGTCASYSYGVEFIIKYFFIYSIYVLARNVITEKKDIECVIVTTLISSLIPVILGFIDIHFSFLKNFMKWLEIVYIRKQEFDGTFAYANTLGIYMSLCIMLSIHRFKINDKKILKALDIIYILIASVVIWKTEAKAIMILLGIILFALFIAKFRKQIWKNRIKIFVPLSIILVLSTFIIAAASKISKDLVINSEKYEIKIIRKMDEGVIHNIELDIEAENDESEYSIQLIEMGKLSYENEIANKEYEKLSGRIRIDYKIGEDIRYIKLIINNPSKSRIKISKCYIDGQEYILNYKYIPEKIVSMLKSFNLNGKSILLREYMYTDCLKIAKFSPVIGNGGNAWKVLSNSVADFEYSTKETHSYFFELLISYGIVGVIAFLSLVIFFFVKIFRQCIKDKEKRKEKLLIALGLFLVLFHSITIDFNMSFMVIQILVYTYMAILLYDEQQRVSKFKHSDIAVIAFLVFILSIFIRGTIAQYCIKDNTVKHNIAGYKAEFYNDMIVDRLKDNKDGKNTLNEIQRFIKKEPYYNQSKVYNIYFRALYKNIDNLSKDELNDYFDYILNVVTTIRFQKPMYATALIERAEVFVSAIKNFEKYKDDKEKKEIIKEKIDTLKKIINEEYEVNIKVINDANVNGYSAFDALVIQKKYESVINNIDKNDK